MIAFALPDERTARRETLVAYYAGLIGAEMSSPAWGKTPDDAVTGSLRIAEQLADRVIDRLEAWKASDQKGTTK